MGGEFKEVEVTNNYKEGYDINGRIDNDIDGHDGGNDFLDYWNNLNDFNDRIVSPVLGIFEGGAIRAGSTITTAKAFNKAALAETLGNVKSPIARICSKYSSTDSAVLQTVPINEGKNNTDGADVQ